MGLLKASFLARKLNLRRCQVAASNGIRSSHNLFNVLSKPLATVLDVFPFDFVDISLEAKERVLLLMKLKSGRQCLRLSLMRKMSDMCYSAFNPV